MDDSEMAYTMISVAILIMIVMICLATGMFSNIDIPSGVNFG